MFAKPYKLKSTNSLKNSDKKNLAQRVLNAFPAATEEKVKELVPVKEPTSCLKLVLAHDQIVVVYAVGNQPMFMDIDGALVPTVCALWKVPDLVPTISIHPPVLSKLLGGAPLYLPGVNIPVHGIGFPMFAKGTLIAACTSDNMAACVVGRAAMGSGDMLLRNMGSCLDIIHVYGDQLCREPKFDRVERPRFPEVPLVVENPNSLTTSFSDLVLQKPAGEWPALGRVRSDPSQDKGRPPPAEPGASEADPRGGTLDAEAEAESEAAAGGGEGGGWREEVPADMDGLLRWCLLAFLRLRARHQPMPLKVHLLYKNHMMALCPADRALDVKRSTYKKIGKFLEAMQREGLIEVKEVDKGVSALVSVNVSHPAVRALRPPPAPPAPAPAGAPPPDYRPPLVKEVYCVTAAVLPLFPNHKKGAAVSGAEARAALAEYVRGRQLASAADKGALLLDDTLAAVLGRKTNEIVKWDAAANGVRARMTAATELQWADGRCQLVRSRLEPVAMAVVSRAGNKKVTLVSNLEAYGFQLAALARSCQQAAGAACGVARPPGARADCLSLQGDQTHFVAKLLVEKYGLPKKYVEGADKALNKKK